MEENMDYYEEEDFNWNSITYIYGMRYASRSTMMDVVYKAIMENANLVLNSGTPITKKVEAIEHILKFFESIEQYEKCAELKKIIDKIKS